MKYLIYQKQLIKKFYFFTMLIGIVFFSNYLLSCKASTEPEKIKSSRRDYSWTEDTLDIKLPNNLTYRYFVGNSSNDIWLGTLDASYDVSLWHYDGIEWKSVFFPGYATSALWLFDDGTLLAGTKESKIWKRGNGEWAESFNLELDGYTDILIFDFYATAKNNIYAVGWATFYGQNIYKAIILHYDGTNWNFVDIPDMQVGFHQIAYQKNTDTYFIHGSNDEHGFLDKVYTFDGKNLKEIMSTYNGISLSEINKTVYIDSDKKIYKYRNNELILWKDFSKTKFLSGFVGRNENDFITNATEGELHFNGVNLEIIYRTNLELQAKAIFEKDIFIASEDRNKNYRIIHGKLKE